MMPSTSTDDGFPVRCEICGNSSFVNVSRAPGDSVCPVCGCFLWVKAIAEVTRRNSFVPNLLIARLDATNRDDALRKMSRLIAYELSWTFDQQNLYFDAMVKREIHYPIRTFGKKQPGSDESKLHTNPAWLYNRSCRRWSDSKESDSIESAQGKS